MTTTRADRSPLAAAPARPTRRLVLGLFGFVLAFGLAGYAWRGHPDGWQAGPADSAANAPHRQGAAQFEAMAARLAERLQREPDDAEGWAMLGRSYAVLGQPQRALEAFRRVVALRPDEAQALADLADASGAAQGRQLAGEPARLVARALQLDPDNVKALALAGTLAFDAGDRTLAARHWAQALRNVEPGSAIAQRLQASLAEAQAGTQDTAPAAPDVPAARAGRANAAIAVPAMPAMPAVAGASSVQVQVALAPALAGRAAPDAAVFIFARSADASGASGASATPRPPLAILRRQVKELPLKVTLDDSLAMSPAARLSAARQVVVGARVSLGGEALPRPGDLQGLSAPVPVGASGVQVTIGEVLR